MKIKTKDVQGPVNRHQPIKTPTPSGSGLPPLRPDRIGLSSFTYSLQSLAPAPRTGPDQGSPGRWHCRWPEGSPAPPASLCRVTPNSPERSLVSPKGRVQLQSTLPASRRWKGEEGLPGQRPSQSEASKKVLSPGREEGEGGGF